MPFTADQERRLIELLRNTDLGLATTPMGNQSEEVAQLRQQVANLMQQRNTGNVMGGMIRTEIAPGAYTVGPYRQDLDASFPIAFDLWIPDYLLRIKRCQMRIKPAAVRSSVSVASSSTGTPSGGGATSGASSSSTTPSGGGSTSGASSSSTTPSGGGSTSGASSSSTTPSGGGSTSGGDSSSVTVNSTSHRHMMFDFNGNGDPGYTSRVFDTGNAGGFTPSEGVHLQTENATDLYTAPPIAGVGEANVSTTGHTHSTPNHSHNIDHTHSTPNHTHDISHTHSTPAHVHDISHTHTTPDHTHPAHSHTLTLAITEGGSASDLEVSIDAVDRTSALGGPWNAAAVVDITDYLVNARLEPVAGAHPIEIRSATVGAVEVWFDFYVIVKAIQ